MCCKSKRTAAFLAARISRKVRTCDRAILHEGPMLEIGTGRTTKQYHFAPLATDFGRGFALTNRVTRESYDVLLDGRFSSCTCPGFEYTGGCKHLDAIQQLALEGRLYAPELDDIDQAALEEGEDRGLEPWSDF